MKNLKEYTVKISEKFIGKKYIVDVIRANKRIDTFEGTIVVPDIVFTRVKSGDLLALFIYDENIGMLNEQFIEVKI